MAAVGLKRGANVRCGNDTINEAHGDLRACARRDMGHASTAQHHALNVILFLRGVYLIQHAGSGGVCLCFEHQNRHA